MTPYQLTEKGRDYQAWLRDRYVPERAPSEMSETYLEDLVILDALDDWAEGSEGFRAGFPNRYARQIVRRLFEAGYIEKVDD